MKKFLVLVLFLGLLLPISLASAANYKTTVAAKARSCPKVSCSIITTLPKGTVIDVIETVEGDKFNGITKWLHIKYNGKDAYVHASLASATSEAAPASGGGNSSGSGSGSTTVDAVPTQPPAAPPQSLTCGTCSEMSSCAQAQACLAAGVSRLDRDGDGIPCESICQ